MNNPSRAEILTPAFILPIAFIAWFWFYIDFTFTINRALLALGILVFMSALILTERIIRFRCIHWYIKDGSITLLKGIANRMELTVRINEISSAEISKNPFCRLLKCSRVRLYSTSANTPFFNMLMPQAQAEMLINQTAAKFSKGQKLQPQYFPDSKYSALISALTSDRFVLMLLSALFLAIIGFNVMEYLIIAGAVSLLAIIYAVCFIIRECRLSVCRVSFGYVLQRGFFSKKIFLPDSSIIGAVELQNPIDMLCNKSRIQLLCAGGRRIFIIHRYNGENGDESVKKLLSCDGRQYAVINDSRALRKLCTAFGAGVCMLSIGIIQAADIFPNQLKIIIGWTLCMTAAITALHMIIQLKSADKIGIALAGSSVRICTMRLIANEAVTLHRGEIFAVIVKQGKLYNSYGRCQTKVMLRSCSLTLSCNCLPYERTLAALARLMK